MQKITLILVLLMSQIASTQMWLVDPLTPIYPDINDLSSSNRKWKAHFAKNTYADVHILIKLPKGQKFTLEASLNNKKINLKYFSELIDVPVEQNTGLDSRTEQFQNKTNPYVIRRAPFKIFEVIKPINSQIFISKKNYSAFRISIPTNILDPLKLHKVNIVMKSQDFEQKGVFTIKVHPVKIPDLSESEFFYTNWFNLSRMEEYHKLKRWSDDWFKMLDKYAQLMAYGRQNSITIPGELVQYENDQISLNEVLLLRFINVFKKYNFKYFESPHLMNRGANDDWGDPELKVALTKRRYYKENGKDDIREIMKLFKGFAVRNNLTNNWLQHIADEPTSINAACYKEVAKQVKSIFPEVKIMEATNDRDGISGAIDIWCPLINDFEENESFFRSREARGEEVLIYTCLIPGGPWLNRTLDMEKLRQVYFGWGAAFYQTKGYLHWGLNQYYADPYKQSVVKHPSPVASDNNYLPAGDTHIIYPDISGPLSSIRFEAHRIGCEDFDLLQITKTEKLKLQNKIITILFRSYTNYNLNLKDYRSTKKKLLRKLY
jgi:hypothetical protein